MVNVSFFFCIILLFLLTNSESKILRGHLVTRENWAFLARFCFLTEQGTFRYEFELGGDEKNLKLLLYYDAPDQWPSVYPSNKTCIEKEALLWDGIGQIVPLSLSTSEQSGCVQEDTITRCSSYRRFRSSRPRWWFIALADCSSKNGLNVSYWISLTNAPHGNFWKEHFSADEFYILPELIIIACIYIVLVILSFYAAMQLRARRLLHVSYKLFMASLLCQLVGILFEIYSYINLGLRGTSTNNASLLGQLLEACSDILYTLLMLLLALGFTVTKSVLKPKQIRWLICFICLVSFCQLSLYIYQSDVFDPGLVLYIYESPPGYGLIILKLIAWIVFSLCCFKTVRKMSTKLHFYGSLFSLGSTWFLCHPLTVLCITLLVDEWIRESVAKGCSLWIVFLGHIIFLYITRPSMANKRFPFHIRTCQVMPIAGDGQDHSYEPRVRTAGSAFTISHLPPPTLQS
ncbi:transmembrane protein 145-like isoform X1 [Osmia bicornis bicornis]|uniref:transmembrane protein 145-like isoform X1 n=1 Tax=Osmia bicornis bicornis TaxID=1437191 RepID=UPI001EAF60EA|nr:transmembrane protein 145-like isoform X1 [Osmia bicornis bicornis]XP_046142438.1 transmembrane protein 145-like isoform X1 [Osmia bicornis bicornis]